MSIDLSAFTFREATAREVIAVWTASFPEWGCQLSLSDYLARELNNGATLQSGPHGLDGMIYWVFVSPENEVVSSVETLRKEVMVTTHEGCEVNKKAYGIASVITMPKWRGKGCAGEMMRRLSAWMDEQDVQCSVLYSDVGNFYNKFGWQTYSSREMVLPVSSNTADWKGATKLSKSDISSIAEQDTLTMPALHNRTVKAGEPPEVAIMPTANQADWHFASEEFVASHVYNPPRKVDVKGAQSIDGNVFAYWSHGLNDSKKELRILRIGMRRQRTDPPLSESSLVPAYANLLRAALAEASVWGLEEVVIWNPDPILQAACSSSDGPRGTERDRDEAIPCLRWKGGGVQRVDWKLMGRYSWC